MGQPTPATLTGEDSGWAAGLGGVIEAPLASWFAGSSGCCPWPKALGLPVLRRHKAVGHRVARTKALD